MEETMQRFGMIFNGLGEYCGSWNLFKAVVHGHYRIGRQEKYQE